MNVVQDKNEHCSHKRSVIMKKKQKFKDLRDEKIFK